ncbi:hypothetical protein Leryth_011815 [Lithospermum erythrorhizon]|nr:hypothetical protein Leryth_011815 [Lithospermum erythrorhizon]
MRTKPISIFMAFGTKGDVYPLAAIAAAFACDQQQYQVFFVTHSAHQNLRVHLESKRVVYLPISSPPVLSPFEDADPASSGRADFIHHKRQITAEHRQDCMSTFEHIFGDDSSIDGDFVVINFFALEGWSLAELYRVYCIVAAPYVVPYSAPASFEEQFKGELPSLYKFLKEAPTGSVNWEDVIHWMWPLYTEEWGSWRSLDLNLSSWPLTDPVTGLPTWHDRPPSPLLLYGFSEEVVECPGYWPPNVHVCGFWFPPDEWQFSCDICAESSAYNNDQLCPAHTSFLSFLSTSAPRSPIFISLSSVGRMGFLRNCEAFLKVLEDIVNLSGQNFILFTAGFGPLDAAICGLGKEISSEPESRRSTAEGISVFAGRVYCFSGSVPYMWLFPKCAAVIHHGGSGTTAAALHTGIPQILCPFILDQFYWAERMFWLGVAPEPLQRHQLLPEEDDELCIKEATNVLVPAIKYALSHEVKTRASEIATKLSIEVVSKPCYVLVE